MKDTPKSLRLQIGLFGRTNVGKSSFLNMVLGQDFAITSHIPGTTTDIVEKTMELLPVGPVVFLDTGGIDDSTELSEKRIGKTKKIFDRADVMVLITEPDIWGEYEETLAKEAEKRKTPVIVVVNKADIRTPSASFIGSIARVTKRIIICSSADKKNRDRHVNELKKYLLEVCPEDFLSVKALVGDLLGPSGISVLIVPIDFEAPKGRIILPQVQAIRDILDHNGICIVVKEDKYLAALKELKNKPDIVVCDSQVVDKMVKNTPVDIKCTTFSILFTRFKSDLVSSVKAAVKIGELVPGDRILIAESCSHHAIEDDIGRVKIPKWLNDYVGGELRVDVSSGRDYPEDLAKYKLIIHCGSCMLTRRETLARIEKANNAGVPVTNYGLCIAFTQDVLGRVLEPFPAALEAYHDEVKKKEGIYGNRKS
ncbi:MAG TPA: [FeFe] hydrogenase H-cluster maturation GTPase HydF [Candidatus Omnitrophota bacterium]|nr:[FeFe] hydrogenase H-cluster maturation GTPase HydF [Candidatus Omnitrophota bacterium]